MFKQINPLALITRVLPLTILMISSYAHAEVFYIGGGDVNSLIAAINASNVNGESDVINLAAGIYSLDSVAHSDPVWGDSGLPPIAQGNKLVINGPSLDSSGSQVATIRRPFYGAPEFRILWNKGNLTLDRIRILGGEIRHSSGGGIANAPKARLKLLYCLIEANQAITEDRNPGGLGGGIFNEGELRISQSTIRNNIATLSGGGINNRGKLVLSGSAILHNESKYIGGGISSALKNAELEATNTTISDNEAATLGGGVNVQNSLAKFNHVTISFNFAQNGGGLFNEQGDITIKNTIVGNNFGAGGAEFNDCTGTITSEGYNLIGENTCNFITGPGDVVGIQPALDELNDHSGGNGQPHTWTLLAGSPAIDAVPLSKCASLDQRGFARPAIIQSSRTPCDMGAHEHDAKPVCLGILTPFVATIVGSAADEMINGTEGPDVIHGLGGNDTINGFGGNDFICGGTGDDTINGDGNNDVLYGQDGDDTVSGGDGSDVIWGASEVGNNTLNGNGGNDWVIGGRGDDTVDGGNGNNDRCNGGAEIIADTQIACEDYKNFP